MRYLSSPQGCGRAIQPFEADHPAMRLRRGSLNQLSLKEALYQTMLVGDLKAPSTVVRGVPS